MSEHRTPANDIYEGVRKAKEAWGERISQTYVPAHRLGDVFLRSPEIIDTPEELLATAEFSRNQPPEESSITDSVR